MVKIYCGDKDITEIVTTINWSGDEQQASRKLDFGIAVSANDYYLPKIKINLGDHIIVIENEKEIFRGFVFFKEKSINSNEMKITAYDGLIYLLKSKGTYNFKNMTPQAITKKVCSDFKISIGKTVSGSSLNHIFDKENIYKIIEKVYQVETNKTGKAYLIKMNEGKLNVTEKGEKLVKFILDAKTTIINSSYSESMENSINKVKIFSEEGKELGEVCLENIPGIMQEIYVKEKGKDAKTQANELLKPIEKTSSIEAIGDIECVVGNSVVIKESYTGLKGFFYITSDEHNFSNNQHTMNLNLRFQRME